MKRFKDPVSPCEQLFLLPPSVEDFVPPDAPVRILGEVIDSLDCDELYASYPGGGAPAYDPRMLLKVLVFGYSQGIRSSRKLAEALRYDLRYMYLAQMSQPDFRTIARFRQTHRAAIADLFGQVVRLCQVMGLVLLERVAVDGTKLEANVSGKETYKADRLEKALARVEEKIGQILEEAEATDAAEDAAYGEQSGEEVPKELRDLKRRKERLEQAKRTLHETGRESVGATDLESRLMKTKAGNRPAYNAQAVVDSAHQVIVAAAITQDECDQAQLEPMLEQTQHNTGFQPAKTLADSGYYSVDALAYMAAHSLDAYVAEKGASPDQKAGYTYDPQQDRFTDAAGVVLPFYRERVKDQKRYRIYRSSQSRKEVWVRQDGALAEQMRTKMASPEGKAIYRLRQEIVEPVFGHVKSVFLLRRLLLRGLVGATIEYLLVCLAHNIGKLAPFWAALRRVAAMN